MSDTPNLGSYDTYYDTFEINGVPIEKFTSTYELSNDLKAGVTEDGLVYIYEPSPLNTLAVLSKHEQDQLANWLANTNNTS